MQAINLLEDIISCSTLFYRPLYGILHQRQPEGDQSVCVWGGGVDAVYYNELQINVPWSSCFT